MAKSKKSKILASMLAVSTMAVFYAAPVMAADLSVALDGQGIVANETVGLITEHHAVTGTLTIGESALTSALSNTDLTLNSVTMGSYTINAQTIADWEAALSANENVGGITRSEGATTPGTGITTIENALSVDGTTGAIYNANNSFSVDANGNIGATSVTTTGDVRTGSYSLNTVGADLDTVEDRTAAITRATVNGQNVTNINGRVVAGGVDMQNGSIVATGTISTTDAMAASDFVTSRGNSLNEVADDLEINEHKTQNIDAERTTAGTTTFNGDVNVDGNVNAGTLSAANGSFSVDAAGRVSATRVNSAGGFIINGQNQFTEAGLTTAGTISAAGGNFNVDSYGNVLTSGTFSNGRFTATNDGNVTGNNFTGTNFVTNDGADLNQIAENTAAISRNENGTVISERLYVDSITQTTGGFWISANGQASFSRGQVMIDYDGNINLENATSGNIIMKDGATVDGVDVSALQADFDTTNANVAGIERETLANGANITTIEGVTEFDNTGMGVYTNTGSSVVGGGNVVITDNNGSFTQIMGGAITAETLNGKDIDDLVVGADIEEDLANISGIVRTDENADGELDTTTIESSTHFNAEGMTITNEDGGNAVKAGTDGSFSAANGNFYISENGEIGSHFTEKGLLWADEDGFNVLNAADNGQQSKLHAGSDNIGMSYVTKDENGDTIASDEVFVTDGFTGMRHSTVNDDGVSGSSVTLNNDGLELYYTTTNPDAKSPTSSIIMNDDGISFSGKVYTGNANDFSFTYNGYTGEGGLNVPAGTYTLGDLVDTVADIYDRTQGISYDSSTGTTTIDGNLNVSGDAETGAGGDANVDGDITAGGDIHAGGDITADGDVTGTNGKFDKVSTGEITVGNNTHIDDNGIKTNDIDAAQGTIGSSVFDESGVTIGGTDGTSTSINGGTITTGNTTIKGDGINVGQGTHIGDGIVSSTTGRFDNIESNTGKIGNATFGQDNTTFGSGDNQTTINNDGITVGENGTSIKHDEISVGDGGYIGGGDVVSGEKVSLNQTAERVGHLENRVGELEDRIDKVGAMAAAIANLRSMGYDPAAPTEVAVGIGQYRDETGAALGLFHYPNRDFMLSLSVSTSGDEVMGGIGATWKFGRKSPEKVAEIKKAQKEADVRRAEAQKLEKAEEMKKAAKEAKIKAQQERHAKLAAERAAQAEG